MKEFYSYLVKRLLLFIPTVILITMVIHLVLHYAGADPVRIMLGDSATQESVKFWTTKLGLDQPVHLQYWRWFKHCLQGDLGTSLTLAQGFPVLGLIKERLPITAFLSLVSMALVIAIPAGTISAFRRRHVDDYVVTTTAIAGISMPDFWLGFMLVIFFSIKLNWFPSMGYVRFLVTPWGSFRSILLPSIAIAAPMAAILARMVRVSLLDTMSKEHVLVAKSYGLPPRDIFLTIFGETASFPL